MTSMNELFGEPISVYTVADAVNDGQMVLVDRMLAEEAGYRLPVVMTRTAYLDLVEWDDRPSQDETGRLWDVLCMARLAAKRAAAEPGDRFQFKMLRVPYLTKSGARSAAEHPVTVHVDVVVQGFDMSGTPCLTILLPRED